MACMFGKPTPWREDKEEAHEKVVIQRKVGAAVVQTSSTLA